jgi:hypothetical protein
MVRRIDEAAEKNRGNEAVGLAADQRVGLSFAQGCAAVLAASICETTPIYRMPKRRSYLKLGATILCSSIALSNEVLVSGVQRFTRWCSNRGGYLNLDQTRAFFRAAIEPHVLRCVGRGMQRTLV